MMKKEESGVCVMNIMKEFVFLQKGARKTDPVIAWVRVGNEGGYENFEYLYFELTQITFFNFSSVKYTYLPFIFVICQSKKSKNLST
jgi:hypothetical protein